MTIREEASLSNPTTERGAGLTSKTSELPRTLRGLDATTIVVGSMIGSGVFLKASKIASRLPEPKWVLAVWAVSGVLTFLGALSIAELGAMRPKSGGLYAILDEAFGPLVAFSFGWSMLAILQTGSIAGLAAGIVERAIGAEFGLGHRESMLAAGALIVTFSALNVVSVRAAAGVQNVLTVAKCLGLLALLFGGFALAHGSFENLSPSGAAPKASSWVSAFGLAMVSALWAFDGWINLSFVAGEVTRPQRNLPRALLVGTGLVTLLYVLVNGAYHYALPLEVVQAAKNPARELALRIGGSVGGLALTLLVTLSSLGTLNSSVLAGPRVFYAMARDGLFFERVGRIHERFGTPHAAIVLQCAWSLALLARWKTFDALTDNVVFVFWIYYGLGAAAVLVLRRRLPKEDRPFRVPGYPVVPILFMLGAALLTLNTLVESLRGEQSAATDAAILFVAGLLLYPLASRGKVRGHH